jgi:hypothetical protein
MAEDAKALVGRMVDALNDHVIDGQEAYWSEDMVWYGPAGIGTKRGLKDFQENHQRPFLHAFPDKSAFDEIRFGEGDAPWRISGHPGVGQAREDSLHGHLARRKRQARRKLGADRSARFP